MKIPRALLAFFALTGAFLMTQTLDRPARADEKSPAPAPAPAPALIDYAQPDQLDPLPKGVASLYRASWRSNVRTVPAADALAGIGIYYKHMPDWSLEQHTAVLKQMAAAGVRRVRIASPSSGNYMNVQWTGYSIAEQDSMLKQFQACKAAGIRPCLIFVHIPAMGEGDEVANWVKFSGQLPPMGKPGSREFDSFLDKTWTGLEQLLRMAREAGFTQPNTYDLEMGQNLWWGFPASKPFPGLTVDMIKPGGQVYEFETQLIARTLKNGYKEPTLWWSQSHHQFDQLSDKDIPAECVGQAFSFYSVYSGITTKGWLDASTDAWPKRDPLKFAEGAAPEMLLSQPESYAANFSRHDNLIARIRDSKKLVAIPSIGVVPSDIPGLMHETTDAKGHKTSTKVEGVDGWQLKSAGLTRSLAFWLNQGSAFVLLHSAYEGADDEMSHALLPAIKDPLAFKWQDSKPLTAMHAFVQPLQNAKKIDKPTDLSFRYALAPDSELIAKSETGGPQKASDAVALLTFQVAPKKFAVAAYVVTPNIANPYPGATMTLQIDKAIAGDITTLRPATGEQAKATTVSTDNATTTATFPLTADVTWLTFETK
ncbi:MAG TPA: hypothetical protein VIL86_09375 [Tepidisphaeraceae bacterium]|jgi:hypothetical protein